MAQRGVPPRAGRMPGSEPGGNEGTGGYTAPGSLGTARCDDAVADVRLHAFVRRLEKMTLCYLVTT